MSVIRGHKAVTHQIQGYTPLHLAADRGHTNLVKLLLGVGADREVEVCPLSS